MGDHHSVQMAAFVPLCNSPNLNKSDSYHDQFCYTISMRDEYLHRASLRVGSSILSGVASALLIEIPLAKTWYELTYNTFLCILSTIAAILVERYLQV